MINADNYSKTMTLRMLYCLLDLVSEAKDLRNERDGLNLMLEDSRKECQRLSNAKGALADCIRDGVERAYPNWDEWQYIAREMLRLHAPTVYKGLDSYETVVKGER